ncbi:MAG TPA: type III polyketide synthase, partial [Gammaproteobacteria bacterium]|nr:type III polyketide synthase [Gammaproteobacteria bacterium]
MPIGITAIGTAVPAFKYPQQEAAELISKKLPLKASERKLLKAIYKATGIDYRYSVLSDNEAMPFYPNDPDLPFPSTAARMRIYKEQALPLALSAIRNCIDEQSTLSADITHVVVVSCTGMYAPGLDIEIIQSLSLQGSVSRTAIQFMGCYGAFNALKVAHALCHSDVNAKVLVVCVELCSIHFQKQMNIDNIISNALFADGAAAVIVQSIKDAAKYFKFIDFYCDILPQSSDAMAWHIG